MQHYPLPFEGVSIGLPKIMLGSHRLEDLTTKMRWFTQQEVLIHNLLNSFLSNSQLMRNCIKWLREKRLSFECMGMRVSIVNNLLWKLCLWFLFCNLLLLLLVEKERKVCFLFCYSFDNILFVWFFILRKQFFFFCFLVSVSFFLIPLGKKIEKNKCKMRSIPLLN